jgi:hypothetical protein
MYLHKILGISSLIHFFIHIYGYTIQQRELRLVAINCHLLLSLSSFIFKVPRKRGNLYVIYKELQLHSIIFTIRSVFVWYLIEFAIELPIVRLLGILSCHFEADYISLLYQNEGVTTVRSTGEWYSIPFMSWSQFVATYICLTSLSQRSIILTIMGIQISAFSGTLVRKGILSSYNGGVLYALSLVIAIYCSHLSFYEHAFILFIYALRTHKMINANKYLLWTSVFFVHEILCRM